MAEPKGKPDGEHIEELLAQLKGIFGHLSEAEQEEVKQKITPPARHEPPPSRQEPPPSTPEPPPSEAFPDLSVPEPAFSINEPAAPLPIEPVPMVPFPEAGDLVAAPASDPLVPNEVNVPPGATLVPTAIFYPAGKINDAKVVSEKVEKITPKFTKVAIVINVQALAAYDPKSDLKSTVLPQLKNTSIKAVLILVDKTMDDTRRRALVAELESKGIYFQEVPFHQIEKKALYTDMLLGMVFFFDSQKPTTGSEG